MSKWTAASRRTDAECLQAALRTTTRSTKQLAACKILAFFCGPRQPPRRSRWLGGLALGKVSKLDPSYAPRVIYTGSGVGPFQLTKMPSRNFLKSFLVMLHDWRICDAVSDTAPTSLPVSSIWSFTSAVRV